MASPRVFASLLWVAAACGDDGSTSASASASESGTGAAGTTSGTAGTSTGATTSPTTGAAGSHSASESETGGASTGGATGLTVGTSGTSAGDTSTGTDASTTSAVSDASTAGSVGESTGACVDACADGEVECVGDEAVRECGVGEGGCLAWGDPSPCAPQQVCEAGACVAGCVDACDEGAKQCQGGGVSTCVDDPMSGCTVWTDAVACSPGQVCEAGVCVTPVNACVDDCVFTKQPIAASVDFYDVWGSDAKHVWVVGASGTAMYYNGVTWKSVDSGVAKRLECVDGSAADDVYATALDGEIIRWDGVEWLPLVDLKPMWESSACVSVLGPGDVLALVYDQIGEKQLLYRIKDGVTTQLGVYPDQAVFTPAGSKARTISLHAFAADEALMTASRVLRWDGDAITNLVAPTASFGLWALAPDFAYAAANKDGIGHRWDGQAWKVVNPGLQGYLHQFTGTAKTRIFALGETQAAAAAIVAFDGIGWTPAAVPADAKALFAGWSAATGEVFAVGKAGTVLIGK